MLRLYRRVRAKLGTALTLGLLAACLLLIGLSLIEWPKPAPDRSLLTDGVCRPPCWEGLVPGKASTDDVRATLESLAYVLDGSVETWQRDLGTYEVTEISWSTSDHLYNVAYLRDDTLMRLHFETDCQTLEDVVSTLGTPTSFEVVVNRGGTYLSLNYASQGVLMVTDYVTRKHWWDGSEAGTLTISPRLCVDGMSFFEPTSLANALRFAYFEPNPSAIAKSLELQQPWQGFGRVYVEAWDGFATWPSMLTR